jgi:hypothetical protein
MPVRIPTRLIVAAALAAAASSVAAPPSNVCPNNKFGCGENIGWTNWKDANAGAQGVVVFTNHLKGFAWGENVGWINTGNGGGPYANTTGANFGVNINPSTGAASGFAWGENIGWINFNTAPTIGAQGARFDSAARRFRGFAWGENVGWINLDSAVPAHFVAALLGDTNGDGACNFVDLNNVLSQFGMSGPTLTGDVSGDNQVNFVDLNIVLSFFGLNC